MPLFAQLSRAFAANLVPAVFLWGFALALLLLYRSVEEVQGALDGVAQLKLRWGLIFAVLAQAVAAALLPFFFQKFQRGNHRKTRAAHLPFLMIGLGSIGATTSLFYDFQAQIFGVGGDFSTLLKKAALDMLVYTPLFCMPLVTWIFALKDHDFSPQKAKGALGKRWVFERTLPLYLGALIVWTPTVFVMYSLPLPLQFPFQAVVQCFWGLVLVVLTAE